MQLRVGYELIYECPQPTPMMLMLNIHHTRASDIVVPDYLTTNPSVPITFYRDAFGNWCTRIVAPAGRTRLSATAIVNDSGVPEPTSRVGPAARRTGSPRGVPAVSARQPLLRNRSAVGRGLVAVRQDAAAARSGCRRSATTCTGTSRSATRTPARRRTAWEVFTERKGVCRDFAHLAVAFCRCMNIPARYCTGYLGDVGMPPPYGPMDFAAWFEAYVDGHWHTFDPRNNVPRIGRVLIARGRDATDVAHQQRVRPQHAGRLQGLDGRNRRAAHVLTAGMRLLTVRHVTVYRYSEPVQLGEHRMMFRPRESHDLRLVRTKLDIRPAARQPPLAPRRVRQLGGHRDVRRRRRSSCASTAPSRWSISRPRCPTTRSRSTRRPIRSPTRKTKAPTW